MDLFSAVPHSWLNMERQILGPNVLAELSSFRQQGSFQPPIHQSMAKYRLRDEFLEKGKGNIYMKFKWRHRPTLRK